jgi:hypothetical protein
MLAALALPTKAHALLTILGEGAVLFLVLLICSVVPWIGKPVSTKRYIAIWSLCIAILVLIGAAFAIKG